MPTITIALAEESVARLREKAARLKIAPEDLARLGVEDVLVRPKAEFERTVAYVLKKNAEIYRRLA